MDPYFPTRYIIEAVRLNWNWDRFIAVPAVLPGRRIDGNQVDAAEELCRAFGLDRTRDNAALHRQTVDMCSGATVEHRRRHSGHEEVVRSIRAAPGLIRSRGTHHLGVDRRVLGAPENVAKNVANLEA